MLTGDNEAKLELLERYLQSKFEMSKLGKLSMNVGVEFNYTEGGGLSPLTIWNGRGRINM